MSTEKLPENVTENPDGTFTVQLRYPIQQKDGELAVVRVRRPRVADLESAERAGSGVAMSAQLTAALTDTLVTDVRKMDASDFNVIDKVIGKIMTGNPT